MMPRSLSLWSPVPCAMPPALPLSAPTARAPLPPVTWRWAASVAAAAAVLTVAMSPPWLPEAFAVEVMHAFRTLCHQMPSRSFQVHGVSVAVCHRCTGIYAGVVAGALVWPLLRGPVERIVAPRVPAVLAASVAPLGIDWGLTFFGLWENTPLTQTATGALAGVVAGVLLARGFAPRPSRAGVATRAIPS